MHSLPNICKFLKQRGLMYLILLQNGILTILITLQKIVSCNEANQTNQLIQDDQQMLDNQQVSEPDDDNMAAVDDEKNFLDHVQEEK